MQTILRQAVGIDIASKTFTACVCKNMSDGSIDQSEVLECENSKPGFKQLIKWVNKRCNTNVPLTYVMEATGIYYEQLAYYLNDLKLKVSVVLPNMVAHFGKSLNIKSKTDLIDARMIARMGAERNLPLWETPPKVLKELRDLTRLFTDLKHQRTMFQNRLHSMQAGNAPLDFIVKSTQSIIAKLDREIAKCTKEIEGLIKQDEWLHKKAENIQTIKGVGLITIAVVIAETLGFKLIKNNKQLTSYAGYDVIERQSGTSVKGKQRISKKGNSRIRAALFFPAMVAAQRNQIFKEDYVRISERRQNKMIALTALQRKMLILIYTLWKNDTVFDEKKYSGNQEIKFLLRS